MTRAISLFCLADALAAPLLAAPAAAVAADVVGRAGRVEVTSAELRAYVETLGDDERKALTKDPERLSQVARAYLARRAVLAELKASKWDQDTAVQARLARVHDEALAELYLAAKSQPPASYPTDAEIRTAYDTNRTVFEVPRQLRLAQVFVAAPGGAPADVEAKARARLDEILKKVAQPGADFTAVAREHTDERGAAGGGELGWLAEAQIVPGIRAAVAGLAKGEISEPVRLDDGWHVVKVLELKPPSTKPLSEVRDLIASELRAERAKANRRAHLSKLLAEHPPALNELELANVAATAK
jgi:peptidylprolyl isomerase